MLEPLTVTGAVVSGSVGVTMEKRVPIRLCNFSTSKAALPEGACLVEAYPEEPSCFPKRVTGASVETESKRVGRIAIISDLPDHLRVLVDTTSEGLSEEQHQCFLHLLLNYEALFAKSDSDLGYLSAVTHKINTGTAKPVRQPVRRTPLSFQSEEGKHLQAMLKAECYHTLHVRVGYSSCFSTQKGWRSTVVCGLPLLKQCDNKDAYP